MTRAVDLLKNKFGISQLYRHDVKKQDEVIFSVYWHPLTIAERESIIKKSGTEDNNDYALQMMIEKALDKDGVKLFQDGDKASLRREVEASILEESWLVYLDIVSIDMGGMNFDHGWLFSNALDAFSTLSSSPRFPTIWRPIGSPSEENPQGIDATGLPDMLNGYAKW